MVSAPLKKKNEKVVRFVANDIFPHLLYCTLYDIAKGIQKGWLEPGTLKVTERLWSAATQRKDVAGQDVDGGLIMMSNYLEAVRPLSEVIKTSDWDALCAVAHCENLADDLLELVKSFTPANVGPFVRRFRQLTLTGGQVGNSRQCRLDDDSAAGELYGFAEEINKAYKRFCDKYNLPHDAGSHTQQRDQKLKAAKKRRPGRGAPPKLTPEQLAEIKARKAAGEKVKDIRKDYPISKAHIYRILQKGQSDD